MDFRSCVMRGMNNLKSACWHLTYCMYVYITHAPDRKKIPRETMPQGGDKEQRNRRDSASRTHWLPWLITTHTTRCCYCLFRILPAVRVLDSWGLLHSSRWKSLSVISDAWPQPQPSLSLPWSQADSCVPTPPPGLPVLLFSSTWCALRLGQTIPLAILPNIVSAHCFSLNISRLRGLNVICTVEKGQW